MSDTASIPVSAPSLHTPFHDAHLAAGARMVDFAGWHMPVNYGSQIDEHHAVRRDAGMFDVSHMLALDLVGFDSTVWLRALLANDVARLARANVPGKALYSCMLREDGGVIDDLIVYRFDDEHYRIVVNAGTAAKDVAWMRKHIASRGFNVSLTERRDLAMLAVQGPKAREKTWLALPELKTGSETLPPFSGVQIGDFFIGRTGYTGEDGFELTLPAARATALWQALINAGVKPCGLGARDTLRLEAGMNLYGQDMDETVSPLDSGLAWTVDFSDPARTFSGRAALEAHPAAHVLLGIVLEERGVLRAHMPVLTAIGAGETTSGSFSPTLEKSIAFARLPLNTQAGEKVEVEIRGKRLPARTVKLPFVRHGKVLA
ncbi:MAG: glycine cleavage system aminomethyltransferase GcvT [Betaproteobacteria bacterium]|nr:glycine cleavage system aminomethyltransferase GcvT [Betaproteobacteria bacterium]